MWVLEVFCCKENGVALAISLFSRKFKPYQLNCSMIEKEALALVLMFMWQPFLVPVRAVLCEWSLDLFWQEVIIVLAPPPAI